MSPETFQIAVSDLEQILEEIEPVFRESEEGFTFGHKSFREVLTAAQFAEEINSGELSVRDAYDKFWSYAESTKLWRLPKSHKVRGLLPAWKPILLYLAGLLTPEKADELAGVIAESHMTTQSHFRFYDRVEMPQYEYLPFFDDVLFAGEFIARARIQLFPNSKDIVGTIIAHNAENHYVRHRTYPFLHRLFPQDYEEIPEDIEPRDVLLEETWVGTDYPGAQSIIGERHRDPTEVFRELREGVPVHESEIAIQPPDAGEEEEEDEFGDYEDLPMPQEGPELGVYALNPWEINDGYDDPDQEYEFHNRHQLIAEGILDETFDSAESVPWDIIFQQEERNLEEEPEVFEASPKITLREHNRMWAREFKKDPFQEVRLCKYLDTLGLGYLFLPEAPDWEYSHNNTRQGEIVLLPSLLPDWIFEDNGDYDLDRKIDCIVFGFDYTPSNVRRQVRDYDDRDETPELLDRIEEMWVPTHDSMDSMMGGWMRFECPGELYWMYHLGEMQDPRAEQALVGKLKDSRKKIRHNALKALMKLNIDGKLEIAASCLSDESYRVRKEAAGILGRMGAAATEYLVNAVNDPHMIVRSYVGDALARSELQGGAEAMLLDKLKSDDYRTRAGAAEVIYFVAIHGRPSIFTEHYDEIGQALIAMLDEPEILSKRKAADALGLLEFAPAREKLEALTEDEDYDTTERARAALNMIAKKVYADVSVAEIVQQKDARVAETMIGAIDSSFLDSARAEDLRQIVEGRLKTSHDIRAKAAEMLGKHQGREAYELLAATFKKRIPKSVRAGIVKGLIYTDSPEVLELLYTRIQDESIHCEIAEACGKYGKPESIPYLEKIAKAAGKSDWHVLCDVAEAIEKIGDRAGEKILLDMIKAKRTKDGFVDIDSDREHSVTAALDAMLAIGAKAGEEVAMLLMSYERSVERSARELLTQRGTKKAIPVLVDVVRDKMCVKPPGDPYYDCKSYDVIRQIHNRLKPKGYNPKRKRLTS